MELMENPVDIARLHDRIAHLERDISVERARIAELERKLAMTNSRMTELEKKALPIIEEEYRALIRDFEAGKTVEGEVILRDVASISGRA